MKCLAVFFPSCSWDWCWLLFRWAFWRASDCRCLLHREVELLRLIRLHWHSLRVLWVAGRGENDRGWLIRGAVSNLKDKKSENKQMKLTAQSSFLRTSEICDIWVGALVEELSRSLQISLFSANVQRSFTTFIAILRLAALAVWAQL